MRLLRFAAALAAALADQQDLEPKPAAQSTERAPGGAAFRDARF